MAHHLAGLIAEAEAATGDAKVAAEARAADLILRLWTRRRELPEAVDPLGPYRDAVEVLSRLRAERNPWLAYGGRGGPEGLLTDLFDAMAKVVVGGILLTRAGEPRAASQAELAALSPEEQALREQLAWWEAAVAPEPRASLGSLLRVLREAQEQTSREEGADGAPTQTDDADPARAGADRGSLLTEPDVDDELLDEAEQTAAPPRRPREQVTEALEKLRADLERLVGAWKAGQARNWS